MIADVLTPERQHEFQHYGRLGPAARARFLKQCARCSAPFEGLAITRYCGRPCRDAARLARRRTR